MPVDLRQIAFYPQQRQYIFSDSEPGIEVVQSGSGDYIKCTDENDAVLVVAKVLSIGTNLTGAATDSRTVRNSCSPKRNSNPLSNGILSPP